MVMKGSLDNQLNTIKLEWGSTALIETAEAKEELFTRGLNDVIEHKCDEFLACAFIDGVRKYHIECIKNLNNSPLLNHMSVPV